MLRARERLAGEGGFSLIELLVVIVIMGVAFIALIGGTLTGVVTSDIHRREAEAEIVLRRFAEEVKAGDFHQCTPQAELNAYVPNDPGWAAGFVLSIPPNLPDDQPEPAPPADPDGCRLFADGLVRLTLRVASASPDRVPNGRAVETVQVIKRGPPA